MTESKPLFKILRGFRRRATEADIKAQLPAGAEILSASPQSALPGAVAVQYTVPESSEKSRGNFRRAAAKPGAVKKPTLKSKVTQP